MSIAGVTPEQVAAAHARLLRDSDIQFQFVADTPPKTPDWLLQFGHWLMSMAPVLQYLFWGLLGLGALFIAAFLVREFVAYRWPKPIKRPLYAMGPEDWRPDAVRARALLEDADRLAADGQYAEAAHVLLYRSIEDIQARRPKLIVPSLTSRDIAGLNALPSAAKGAFGLIARHVERSAFGGRVLDAAAFAECRGAYEAFAFPEQWRAA